MRITFVSSHAKQGGSERYLAALVGGLPPDVETDVVALEDGALAIDLAADVIPTGARSPALLLAATRLRRHLSKVRPDVVHANGVKAALVSVLATGGWGPPIVWVKHDFSWDGWLAKAIGRRCRLIVGVSHAVVAGLPTGKVRVVSPGITEPVVDVEDARRTVDSIVPSRPVFALVGRFHPVRGHLELVAAAAHLPQGSFLFVGGDDESQPGWRARVVAAVDTAGLTDRVVMLGHREDALVLLAGSDVAVLPTVADERGMGEEGFGLVAVEAMAVGTPVVGYRSGALPEVLGECGLVVPSGDRTALAQAMVEAVDGDVRTRLVGCGRARARSAFSKERWLAEMVVAYAEVTARRTRRAARR